MAIQTAPSAPSLLRRVFDRRAAAFDRVAFLPREIASRMQQRLDYIKVAPQHILDAGCGVGSDLSALSARYPASQLAGADLSHAMLRQAAHRPSTANDGVSRWLPDALRRVLGHRSAWLAQADFTSLPFANGCFDIVWSNLALQWHPQPDQVFPEWQRVLAVGGLLMFSTLGPDTLQELRAAWHEAYRAVHGALPVEEGTGAAKPTGGVADGSMPTSGSVPPAPVLDFVDMHDFGDMLVASGFELPVMDMERLTITYREPAALLADVRGWGAFRALQRRGDGGSAAASSTRDAATATAGLSSPGMMGRRLHRAWMDALASRRQPDGTIPLTFEIIYGHAWKAAPRMTADGQAIVRLDDIGGRRSRR